MNRLDVQVGIQPPGLCLSNNCNLKHGPCVSGDTQLMGAIELLHDPNPARDMMLFWLRETRKSGMISPGIRANGLDAAGNYVSDTAWFCGVLHKYLLTTGDLALLDEDIGGKTVLQRVEEAVESQLEFRHKETGLFPNAAEMDRFSGEKSSDKPGMRTVVMKKPTASYSSSSGGWGRMPGWGRVIAANPTIPTPVRSQSGVSTTIPPICTRSLQ